MTTWPRRATPGEDVHEPLADTACCSRRSAYRRGAVGSFSHRQMLGPVLSDLVIVTMLLLGF